MNISALNRYMLLFYELRIAVRSLAGPGPRDFPTSARMIEPDHSTRPDDDLATSNPLS
jgi:hypothetical protein